MAYLFDTFWFEPGSRMTGMFTARAAAKSDADVVVLATQVQLGRDQDGSVECDFLQSLLPFSCGGFHGVGPDRDPWVVLLQIAPATAASLVGADDPAWPMVDAMDRALRFNPEAQVQDEARWTRSDLLDIYEQAGVEPASVADWPTADLLHGLLAECCYVPLEQVVAGRLTQCAFPDLDHECEHDVFRDVFAMWTTGQLTPPEEDLERSAPEESPARNGAPGGSLGYAVESTMDKRELRAMTTSQLRKIASLTWGKRKVDKMKRKELIHRLSRPHWRQV